MNKNLERLKNGIITENPTFVLMLGMCPTLAVTTSAVNGIGMGLATTAVLIMSNMMISALRKVIPDGVRMPAYIVIVASFVTIVEMLLHAYVTPLYNSLGIYIPLIVVNCIILGRAESYASKIKSSPLCLTASAWVSASQSASPPSALCASLSAPAPFSECAFCRKAMRACRYSCLLPALSLCLRFCARFKTNSAQRAQTAMLSRMPARAIA